MGDIHSYEKIVKLKAEGKILSKKIIFICIYAFLVLVGIPFAIVKLNGNIPIILTLTAMIGGFIYFSWKQTNIEYEYSIISGTFFLTRIYGKSRRKEVFEAELHDAVIIAPFNEAYCEQAEKCAPDDVFYAISSRKAKNAWFIIFDESGGVKTLILFEADERAISTLRHYCPRATVRDKSNLNNNCNH